MALAGDASSAQVSPHGPREGQGRDGRWMLKLIYPHAVSLDAYLEIWLHQILAASGPSSASATLVKRFGGTASFLCRHDDTPEFKEMLKETLVAYCPPPGAPGSHQDHAPLPRHASLQHQSSMADLLDRVVKSLLQSSSTGQGSNASGYYAAQGDDPRRNVLSLGCRVAGPQARSELLSVPGVACAFPNTTVNVIRSPPWDLLLSRIGDDLMFALLRQHAVLHRLPNRCFMQLAGRPVPDVCRQLGLTAGTLSASAAVMAGGGTASGKKGAGVSVKISVNNACIRDRGMCTSSASGDVSKLPMHRKDHQILPAAGVVSTPSAGEEGAHSLVRDVGAATPKGKPGLRPAVLLPRHRIFYSNTFVRKAGFPRGHPLSPFGERPRSTDRSGSARSSASYVSGSDPTTTADTERAATTTLAARCLAIDMFCASDGDLQTSHGAEGTQGIRTSRPGPQWVGSGSMSTGGKGDGVGKVIGKGSRKGRKLPKRLRKAIPLLGETIQRAHRCNFGRLLEAHCPLPESLRGVKARRTVGQGNAQGVAEQELSASSGSSPRGGEFENEVSVAAWWGADMDGGDNGKDVGGHGKEREGLDSGSTLQGTCFQSSAPEECANTRERQYSKSRVPGEREVKRHRVGQRHDCTRGGPKRPIEGGARDCQSSPNVARDAALDAAAIDSELRRGAKLGATNTAASGARADHSNPASPFSLDPNVTFMEMATEHRRVVDFVCEAFNRIFPTDLWGSKHNMVRLAKAVERFIVLRRHESMSISEVTTGMRTSDFRWMDLDENGANFPRVKADQWGNGAVNQVDRSAATGGTGVVLQTDCGDPIKMPSFERPGAETPLDMVAQASSARAIFSLEGEGREDGGRGNGKQRQQGWTKAGSKNENAEGLCSERRPSGEKKVFGDKAKGDRKSRQSTRGKDTSSTIKGRGKAAHNKGNERKKRRPPSDLAKRAKLLEALVLWTFKDVIVPLLRSTFYVTECETASIEVFFFRKPVWAQFRTASVRHLAARQYRRITAEEAFSSRSDEHNEGIPADRRSSHANEVGNFFSQNSSSTTNGGLRARPSGGRSGKGAGHAWTFPVSEVRLVPKQNGVRAITNLSRRFLVDRDRVQWVKGVPLPAPRRDLSIQSTVSNASLQPNGDGVQREARAVVGRLEGEAVGGVPAAIGGGRGRRGKLGAGAGPGAGAGTNGGPRVLLPSTNMQLSSAFHVLKHEYLNKPSLVGAGVFGLDDVFARIKPFVSRNLRPLSSPVDSSGERDDSHEDGSNQEHLFIDRVGGVFAQGASDVTRLPCALHGDDISGANSKEKGAEEGPGKHGGQRQKVSNVGPKYPGDGGNCESDRPTNQRRHRIPPLYFASVDIKHCYDTVDQARLIDIVRPLVTSADYVIQKYAKAHPFKAMGRVQVSHVKEAVAMENMSQFRSRCEELANGSVDTVFTDQVVYGIVSRSDVLDIIEDHITRSVVRVQAAGDSGRGAYFQQAMGIPQGSVLSGLLCNYFFGHIEKRLLGDILKPLVPPESNSTAVGIVKPAKGNMGDGGQAVSFCCGRQRESEASGKLAHIGVRSFSQVNDASVPDSGGGIRCNRKRPHPSRETDSSFSYGDVSAGISEAKGHGGDPHGEQGYGKSGVTRCGWGRTSGDEHMPSKEDLHPFPDPAGDCTLLRQVDDFLLVTTNKARAEDFVRVMHDKTKTGEWGFAVHEAKTLVNFDMAVKGDEGAPSRKVRRIDGKMFPWCGLRFDTTTCEVMANYSRYSTSGVSESVTVESRRPGACLLRKMKRFMSPKCHALLLDEGELGMNSRHKVLLNVYEMLLVCAAKTAVSALRLPHGPGGNSSLLSNGASEVTRYAYSLIQSRSNRRKGSFGTSNGVRCVCKIHRFEVTWLGLHAFQEVYSAFSVRFSGFTRPKLDMQKALADLEGPRRMDQKKRERKEGPEMSSEREGKAARRRRGASDRLRRVVRCADALNLLRTLTVETAD